MNPDEENTIPILKELHETLDRLKAEKKKKNELPKLREIQSDVWKICVKAGNCKQCPFNSIDPPIHQCTCVWVLLSDIATLIEYM